MRLKFASIITTYRCNFRCHMCNTWQHPSDVVNEITPADLAKLPEVGTINVTGGEPFLRDDLSELVSALRPKTQRIVISTNGYLTERVLALAKRHPWIGIRISVEGLPAANDYLRGVKDGFDHALETLVELKHLGIKDVGFGITLSDRNAESLLPLYHTAKLMHLEFATAAVHNSFYFHKTDNAITREAALANALTGLIQELLKSNRPKAWFRAYFNWGLLGYIRGEARKLPCTMGEDAFFVDPYGEVLPCNGTSHAMSFGNIKRSSFQEIWEGLPARTFREQLRDCPRNCWMMGSVAEPMKRHLPKVARWVVREKFRVQMSRESSRVEAQLED